ncbi:MAG: type II toxin-antitoxin system VapC family toxin [Candidatus Dormibacteria bacterium]
MVVLDTDTLSALSREHDDGRIGGRLRRLPTSDHATTAITVGEIVFGSHRARRPAIYITARRLLDRMHVLPFDDYAAEAFGVLKSGLTRRGELIAEADMRIAAITLVHDATLITGNTKHFARVPHLKVADWIRG